VRDGWFHGHRDNLCRGVAPYAHLREVYDDMTSATTFRAAIGVAAVFLLLAIAAFIWHFASPIPHPFFGAKVGILLLLVALICGVYANYNRPSRI